MVIPHVGMIWAGLVVLTLFAAAPVRADDRADSLFKEVVEATKAVKTLSADLILMQDDGAQKETAKGKIRLKKPNLARIMIEPPMEVIASDGKDLYTLLKQDNLYIKNRVFANGENISVSYAYPISIFFQLKLPSFVPREMKPTYSGTETLEGVEYQILEIRTEVPVASLSRYYVSPQKLITRMTAELQQEGRTLKLSAVLTHVKTDVMMTDASFAFKPPQGATQRDGSPEGNLLAVGARAPEFHLDNSTGGHVSLEAACKAKKAVLVNFWFYNCGGCREEFPHLQKLYAELKDKGFDMIAVNGIDSKDIINKYVTENHFTFTSAMSKHGVNGKDSVARQYGVMAYPVTYLIGPDSKILYRSLGYNEAGLYAALEQAGLK